MACSNKITSDILYDCADMPKKGIDGNKAVLINVNDIDWTATTSTGAIVSALALSGEATGFQVTWYKDLASATGAFAPNAEDIDGFTHSFLSRIANTSAENAERANELKNGRFIMVYETTYKGVANAEAFKIAGFENGLTLSELAMSTAENSGSMTYTLTSREGPVEQYPYHIFLDTDYATSKAAFDALFVEAD